MKKIFFIFLLAVIGSSAFAGSYQRWIVWVSEPNHLTNRTEMVDIFASLCDGKIYSNHLYQVGITTFRISNPDQYLDYLKRCIQKSDPSATTVDAMKNAIRGGEVVRWGNDISCKVKNYWMNSNGEVTFTDNYTGAELGVWVLLINGIPTIKLDCGNPLEMIIGSGPTIVPTPITQQPTTTTGGNVTINSNNTTTNITNNYYGNNGTPVNNGPYYNVNEVPQPQPYYGPANVINFPVISGGYYRQQGCNTQPYYREQPHCAPEYREREHPRPVSYNPPNQRSVPPTRYSPPVNNVRYSPPSNNGSVVRYSPPSNNGGAVRYSPGRNR